MENTQLRVPYIGIFLGVTAIFTFGIFLLVGSNSNSKANDTDAYDDKSLDAQGLAVGSADDVQDVDELKSEITKEGEGEPAKAGDTVEVHYDGRLLDGTKFDSSYDRGQTFKFTLGEGRVIEGWDVGVEGMKKGEKRTLTIPSSMGYGEYGSPPAIPGGAGLVFDVEMVDIIRN